VQTIRAAGSHWLWRVQHRGRTVPTKAKRPCSYPGCPALVDAGRFCADHAATNQNPREARPNAYRRGYGGKRWDRTRRRIL